MTYFDENLFDDLTDYFGFVRGAVAANASIPTEILIHLSKSEHFATRWGVARNPMTPPHVLKNLADLEFNSANVCLLASHPSLPILSIEKLATHEDANVRVAIIRNPSAPKYIIDVLEKDGDLRVRKQIVESTKSPELLSLLSHETDLNVRKAVAGNILTSQHQLRSFVNDQDVNLRGILARNPSTPVETLSQLMEDSDELVRSNAANNPSSITGNPNTSIDSLIRLSKNSNPFIRAGVAGNFSTPEVVLMNLIADEEALVRVNVWTNPVAPEQIFGYLTREPSDWVRREVASSPLLKHWNFIELKYDDCVEVRAALAGNISTPPQILADLGNEFLEIIAENSSTPPTILAALAKDEVAGLEIAVGRNPSTPIDSLVELATRVIA